MGMLVALLAFSVMPAFSAEEKAWNSSKVLALSDDLVAASRNLNRECRQAPPNSLDEGTTGHLQFRYHVRHLIRVASELSEDLEDGDNGQDTLLLFNELSQIVTDLKKYAGGERSKSWPVLDSAVLKVDSVVMELAPYYSTE